MSSIKEVTLSTRHGEPRARPDGMHNTRLYLSFAVWILATAGGMLWMIDYSSRPGREAVAPESWPAESPLIQASDRPTLLMFVHPQCSCTRASVRELERIIAQTGGARALQTYVVFFAPGDRADTWVEGDVWQLANALPGAQLVKDRDGSLFDRFGVYTSGQTLVYDTRGTLQFRGGVTGARAHEGDNAGHTAIVDFVRDQQAAIGSTFVFGCSVQEGIKTAFSWLLPSV